MEYTCIKGICIGTAKNRDYHIVCNSLKDIKTRFRLKICFKYTQ